jgi:hypothetical protein
MNTRKSYKKGRRKAARRRENQHGLDPLFFVSNQMDKQKESKRGGTSRSSSEKGMETKSQEREEKRT